jgi:hypothetical protein
MIGEVEEMNGKMEGQLLERVAHEAALAEQIKDLQARNAQGDDEIASLKVMLTQYINI